jgi:hypothetical protein
MSPASQDLLLQMRAILVSGALCTEEEHAEAAADIMTRLTNQFMQAAVIIVRLYCYYGMIFVSFVEINCKHLTWPQKSPCPPTTRSA